MAFARKLSCKALGKREEPCQAAVNRQGALCSHLRGQGRRARLEAPGTGAPAWQAKGHLSSKGLSWWVWRKRLFLSGCQAEDAAQSQRDGLDSERLAVFMSSSPFLKSHASLLHPHPHPRQAGPFQGPGWVTFALPGSGGGENPTHGPSLGSRPLWPPTQPWFSSGENTGADQRSLRSPPHTSLRTQAGPCWAHAVAPELCRQKPRLPHVCIC